MRIDEGEGRGDMKAELNEPRHLHHHDHHIHLGDSLAKFLLKYIYICVAIDDEMIVPTYQIGIGLVVLTRFNRTESNP